MHRQWCKQWFCRKKFSATNLKCFERFKLVAFGESCLFVRNIWYTPFECNFGIIKDLELLPTIFGNNPKTDALISNYSNLILWICGFGATHCMTHCVVRGSCHPIKCNSFNFGQFDCGCTSINIAQRIRLWTPSLSDEINFIRNIFLVTSIPDRMLVEMIRSRIITIESFKCFF